MSTTQVSGVKKVEHTLRGLGYICDIVELQATTRTSSEAALAVGCRVEQIAKSIVFEGELTHRPILVVASGPNRVNEKKIAELTSELVKKADALFVREKTGFVIGGVPPVGHLSKPEVFIDEELLKYDQIWAAGGSPYAVFRLTPSELINMTGGRVVSIK